MVYNYFDGSKIESLEEYMKTTVLIIPENELFTDTIKYDSDFYDYPLYKTYGINCGRYVLTVNYSKGDVGVYEYVYIGQVERTDENSEIKEKTNDLLIVPISCSDDRIIELIKDINGNLHEEKIENYDWKFIGYNDERYDTKEDELITFNGDVRKIKENDLYKQTHGINYQTLPEECDEEGRPLQGMTLNKSVDVKLWNEIMEDNCMGRVFIGCVNNIGGFFVEQYCVNGVDGDEMYLIDDWHEPVFGRNMPETVIDEKTRIKYCYKIANYYYKPYSLEEAL